MKNGTTIDVKEYSYDDRGNIVSVVAGGKTTTYVYDDKNQLVRENNQALGKSYTYSYDSNGNIIYRHTYTYTTGALGTAKSTDVYSYANEGWGDLLTAYKLHSFTYDSIGNPLSYYNGFTYNFTWQKGRQLSSATKLGNTYTYAYNQDGIRIEKTVVGKIHQYVLNGTQIEREIIKTGNTVVKDIYYYYDASGIISSAKILIHSGSTVTEYNLVFLTNMQGDVYEIYLDDGTKIASYNYDAWGNITTTYITTNTTLRQLADEAPFRYRGYYFDSETGFYYLNTRYYDPKICRFINADDISYLGANGDLQAYNLYAYCSNNPVMGYDPMGTWDWRTFVDVLINVGATIVSAVVGTVATTIGGVEAGVVAATATHGAINNAANAIYYNNFAIDENVIVKEPESSKEQSFYVTGEEGSYGYRYINRFDRLDYTKSVVKSDTYDANTWRYYSEYNAHMYVWGISYWAKNSGDNVFAKGASSTFNASVLNDAWDPNIGTSALTVITGILGW